MKPFPGAVPPDGARVVLRDMCEADVAAVIALAARIWNRHYPGIISRAQIDYMLAQRYRPERLRAELADAEILWTVAAMGVDPVGFSSVHLDRDKKVLKLDKLYVDSALQRQGVGRRLVEAAFRLARDNRFHSVELAVNRNNDSAITAYLRMGFVVRETRVADIGGGFVMDDFIMTAPVGIADPA